HWHFQSGGFDLGIFEQAIWHLSRFETPANSFGRHPNIFGDHFHPIIAVIVPFYWLVPTPETLLVFQSVVVAATLLPVYIYSRARAGATAAVGVTIACGLFWGLQKAAAYDFHELSFAPLLIALAILGQERRDTRTFATASVLLCFVKEDM